MYGIALTSEGTTEAASSMLDTVIEVVPKVIELAGTCFEAILDNEVLLFFFAVGLVGIGIGVFAKLKAAAQG